MSPLEYGLNFSSEILVAILVVLVAGLNIVLFNPFSDSTNHQDKSLAAHLLGNHSSLNNQLAIKHNTVSTTVSGNNSFISQAFADQTGSVLSATDTIDSEESIDGIEDNGISKANPDSIKKLVSRQVQIYETKPFDTVYTVAKQFNVSTKTIRDTNGLPDHSLKAGWFLVIPPVDGLVLQITNPNITLADVSDKYSADINKIVSYNGLANAEDMVETGDYLVVPHGVLPASAPAPAPVATNNKTAPAPVVKKSSPAVPKATISGNHKFAPGYCTDYVARKVAGIKWGGNANRWIANSKAYGATVDRNPVAGAILVTNENSRYGHVAYIEKVSGSKVTFSEWNYAGLYKTTTRTMDISDSRIKGVIHP
jgi:surface antigen